MFKAGSCFICCFITILLPVTAKIPSLIFPPTAPTRTQWISGIGIPLQDLNFEALTTGYVLKAEYFLPDNVTQLKTQSVRPFERKFGSHLRLENFLNNTENVPQKSLQDVFNNNDFVVSSYRWTFYKGLEGLANRMGLAGRDCILKSICESAETPFHYYNGLFGELLYILLTPSSSADKLSTHSDNEYFHAEYLGHSGANCQRVFQACPRSLLDYFSNIQQLSQGIINIVG